MSIKFVPENWAGVLVKSHRSTYPTGPPLTWKLRRPGSDPDGDSTLPKSVAPPRLWNASAGPFRRNELPGHSVPAENVEKPDGASLSGLVIRNSVSTNGSTWQMLWCALVRGVPSEVPCRTSSAGFLPVPNHRSPVPPWLVTATACSVAFKSFQSLLGFE